jgi:DNA-binding response OmpR family regulator
MIRMILEYSGYSVLVSDRGEQTEELVRNNHIDLLIMDMFLSGINGTDICRRLKHND